jgi:hypothetical protein
MDVPKYLWKIIALYMPIRDVVALENCCKRFQSHFDEAFWKSRLLRDFQNDASFIYHVDVPARTQYREISLFKPDPKERNPFLLRVALIGPGASNVFAAFMPMATGEKSDPNYFYAGGQVPQADKHLIRLRVGLLRKTFDVILMVLPYPIGTVNLDACVVCLGVEANSKKVVESSMKQMQTLRAAALDMYGRPLQGKSENKSMVQVVSGLGPKLDLSEYDYPMQKSLVDQYQRCLERLKELKHENLIEKCSEPNTIPFVTSVSHDVRLFVRLNSLLQDNEVLLLRTLLEEITFRLKTNKVPDCFSPTFFLRAKQAIGTMMGHIHRLKRLHPEFKEAEIEADEEEEEVEGHKKCVIS